MAVDSNYENKFGYKLIEELCKNLENVANYEISTQEELENEIGKNCKLKL